MPHLILEYSANLRETYPTSKTLAALHHTMIKSGLFTAADIKSRAYEAADYLVGETGTEASFAHVRVYLLEGRSLEQRKALSEALFSHLARHLPQAEQHTVDIRELNKETYRKKLAIV